MKKNNYIFNDKVNKIWFIFLPIIWTLIRFIWDVVDFGEIDDAIFSSFQFGNKFSIIAFISSYILLSLISPFIRNELRLIFQIVFVYLIIIVHSICGTVYLYNYFDTDYYIIVFGILFGLIAFSLGIVYAITKNKIFCWIMLPINIVIAHFMYIPFNSEIITVITMFLLTVALVSSYKKSYGCKVNQIETSVENTIIDSKLPEVIRQYKELLDSGVITEEEYNEKKNELLH